MRRSRRSGFTTSAFPRVLHAEAGRRPAGGLNIERGVPEVFGSTYDIRTLLSAASRLRDGKELPLPGPGFLRAWLLGKIDETEVGELLTEFGLLPDKPA